MLRMLMFLSLAFVCAACQQADRGVPAAVSADEQDIPVHVTPSVAVRLLTRGAHESQAQKHQHPRHWTTSCAYSMLLAFGAAQLRNLPTTAARNE